MALGAGSLTRGRFIMKVSFWAIFLMNKLKELVLCSSGGTMVHTHTTLGVWIPLVIKRLQSEVKMPNTYDICIQYVGHWHSQSWKCHDISITKTEQANAVGIIKAKNALALVQQQLCYGSIPIVCALSTLGCRIQPRT